MKTPLTIRLSPEARKALALLAQRDARSMSSMIEKMIQDEARAKGVWTPQPVRTVAS